MLETLLVLLAAHFTGDFLLQRDWLVKAKDISLRWLLVHCGILTAVTAVFLAYFEASWALLVYPLVFILHLLIDVIKRAFGKVGVYALLVDQAAHIILLAVVAGFMPDLIEKSCWVNYIPIDLYLNAAGFIGGLVVCVFAGDIVISKAVKSMLKELPTSNGLEKGGKYIGRLERALTFFFMLTGQTNAIGFLFAAKSILRFGEIKNSEQRKEAEYIIIGTFMSFGWALVTAYITKRLIYL